MRADALARTAANQPFSAATLRLDGPAEIARISAALRGQVREKLRKRGIVLGLSGGIDSSVTAGLAALLEGPGVRTDQAQEILARQPLMPSHPSVAGTAQQGPPPRPPRAQPAGGGLRFERG